MAEPTPRSFRSGGIVAVAAGIASALLAVAVVRLLVWARTGFEFTDESMHILSADARADASFHNAFGSYTGLLFDLVGGDIAWFRRLGIVILAAAGLALGERVVVFVARPEPTVPLRILGATIGSTGALHYYLFHLTPSYNWLNITGTLIALAGVVHLLGPAPRRTWIGGTAAALGTLVAFMGKFSAPAAVAVVTLILLAIAVEGPWRERLQHLTPVLAPLAILVVAHHVLVESWPTTIERIRDGSNRLLVLDPDYTLGEQVASIREAVVDVVTEGSLLLLPVIAAVVFHEVSRGRSTTTPIPIGVLATGAVAVTSLIVVVDDRWAGGVYGYQTLAWVGVTLVLTAALMLVATRTWNPQAAAVAIGGTAAASAYAVGSNNGFLVQLNGGTGFLFCAALALLLALPRSERSLPVATFAVIAALAVQVVISDSQNVPYRQPPVSSQTVEIELAGGTVRVHPQTAEFATELRADADAAGWTPGTPLLDLSPYAAGTLVLLDATPPPSILVSVAGYTGQQALADDSIGVIVDTDIADLWRTAWVLTAEEAVQPGVEPAALAPLQRTFPDEYERVGAYRLDQAGQTLVLWRPNDT